MVKSRQILHLFLTLKSWRQRCKTCYWSVFGLTGAGSAGGFIEFNVTERNRGSKENRMSVVTVSPNVCENSDCSCQHKNTECTIYYTQFSTGWVLGLVKSVSANLLVSLQSSSIRNELVD